MNQEISSSYLLIMHTITMTNTKSGCLRKIVVFNFLMILTNFLF